jgi:hypothetical protein
MDVRGFKTTQKALGHDSGYGHAVFRADFTLNASTGNNG